MTTVGFDVSPLVQTRAGTARYVEGLGAALERLPDVQITRLSFGGPGRAAALAPAPGCHQAEHDHARQGQGQQRRRDRDRARRGGKLAEHPGRRDVGLPLARQPVPGLELLGGGQRLRTEYPVVINARVRRVDVEQLLQRGDARAFLRVGDDGRAGREADVVAVAHRRLISVVSAENCEQRHEKD